jgi:hypothetical protein
MGALIRLEDRKVGDILRNELGIAIDTRSNRGYPILADCATFARIHQLVEQLDILRLCKLICEWCPAECNWCREAGFVSKDEMEKYEEDHRRRVAAAEVRTRPARAEFARMRRQMEEEQQVPSPSRVVEDPGEGGTVSKS